MLKYIILIQKIFRGYYCRKTLLEKIKLGICEDCNKKTIDLIKVKACLDYNCCYKYICKNMDCDFFCYNCCLYIPKKNIIRNKKYPGYIYPLKCNFCKEEVYRFKSWWGDAP